MKKPNSNRYPPGDLPKISRDELKTIRDKPAKLWTKDDVQKVTAERDRANRKIGFMRASNRPDAEERASSANGTAMLASVDAFFERGIEYSKAQSKKAQCSRSPEIDDEGGTLRELIRSLARQKDALGDPLPPRDLWPQVEGALRDRHLELELRKDVKGQESLIFTVARTGDRREISFGTFENVVIQARKSR